MFINDECSVLGQLVCRLLKPNLFITLNTQMKNPKTIPIQTMFLKLKQNFGLTKFYSLLHKSQLKIPYLVY